MKDEDLYNMDKLVFDHTYGPDTDAYGRKQDKEGPTFSLWGDTLGIDIQAEKTDYDLLCPWECVTLRLDYEEVEKLKNYLENCLNKFYYNYKESSSDDKS